MRVVLRIRGKRFTLGDMIGAAVGLVVTIVWMAPTLWMVSTSLKPEDQVLTKTPQWLPREITFDHYIAVFDSPMLRWYWNSISVAVITTVLTIVMASMAGYALARLEFPGRDKLFIVYIMSIMIPFEVLVIPLFLMLAKVNLTDTHFSLIVPLVAGSFSVYLFRQFFFAIPTELEDAAMIDGCNRFGVFFRIALPLAKAVIVASAIITFAASWNNLFWPLITISSDASRTVPVGVFTIAGVSSVAYRLDFGRVMAGAAVASLPGLIMFVMLQRHFVKGVAVTGIK